MSENEIGWSTQDLQTSSQACLNGMEQIREDAAKDEQKHFYRSSPAELRRLKTLQRYPAIARVLLTSEKTGNELEIFVCNGMPPVGDNSQYPHASMPTKIHERSGMMVASYDSPMGSFASYDVGDVDRNFYIQEIEKLFPEINELGEIDSTDTQLRNTSGIRTIKSLRQYLAGNIPAPDSSWLEDEVSVDNLVTEGVVRRKKKTFGLDVIVVNKLQDKIFREPIDSRFVLLGAPGTGKTTTMIYRLRSWMGSNWEQGENADPETVQLIEQAFKRGMQKNWVLFVPTALLKEYVRNAMDAQGIGQHLRDQIQTWDEYSYQLGFSKLGFYNRSSQAKGFVRKDISCLSIKAQNNAIPWYEAFENYRDKEILQKISAFTDTLCESEEESVLALGERLKKIINGQGTTALSVIGSLLALKNELETISNLNREFGRAEIIKLAYQCDKKIKDLKSLWENLLAKEKAKKVESEDDIDDGTDDLEDLTQAQKPGEILKNTLRSYVISVARKKVPEKGQLADRYALLKAGLPNEIKAQQIGKKLLEGQAAGQLARAFFLWSDRIVKSYKSFRRQDLQAEHPVWYDKETYVPNGLCSAELDLLILSHLKAYRMAESNRLVYRLYQDKIDDFLNQHCKMMVFVDELTDFSPIQLACMYQLAHPALRSFMACGDINQRLTSDGIRTLDEIKWAVPVNSNDIIALGTVYRQTKVLHALGQHLLALNSNAIEDTSVANEEIKDEGVKPVLHENCETQEQEAEWIAERIDEIFNLCNGELPTIAVFVPEKNDVSRFADLLAGTEKIQNNSLRIEACPEGNAIAADIKVGVYSVDKIKGLEFEAVFFTNIDDVIEKHGDKYAQYLYVGATRAIQFFGLTCRKSLPNKLSLIQSCFIDNWKQSE